jgi:HK97 family phage prohead protease/N4-gp56 family major capsid protein
MKHAVDKNKVLYLNSTFVKELQSEGDDSITISGYASTTDVDRHGDVVTSTAWAQGLKNYLKNPIILAYHDHSQPVGRMIEHKVDNTGLWVKARISQASGNVYKLIKDGILSAFSIGFKIVDAEYNQATELFMVKELELHEISVVSIPANQNTLFNLSKAFETAEEYQSFVMHFAPKSESAKGLESSTEAEGTSTIKEWKMNPEEIKQALADAARQGAEEATKSILAQQEQQAKAKAAQEQADRELETRIKAAVAATVETGKSGAERLLEEVEKRFQTQADESRKAIEGLEAVLKEKAQELEAIQKSKMQFTDDKAGVSYADKERAVLLSKMTGKSLESTRYGRQLIEKAGPHLPSNTWELEVSLRMEEEVRRRLVVAPTLRNIAMQTNVMTIPVNPEAGVATWVTNAQFGTADSRGNNATHQLKEITLNAYKVATNEYMAYEEEEDSLLALMPVVRDAMVRRVARAVDRAFLRGAGAGADPVKGLVAYDAVSAVNLDISDATKATVAILRSLRADLGAWGLDPAEVIYVVSTEVYYDLLDDTTFQTMDKVGTQATLLTGQIGTIANSAVLVSAEFDSKGAGAAAAVAYAPGNFLVGNQRGLRIDTQDLVETQRKVMVASLRTGMTQVTTNLGGAVSALRYVA